MKFRTVTVWSVAIYAGLFGLAVAQEVPKPLESTKSEWKELVERIDVGGKIVDPNGQPIRTVFVDVAYSYPEAGEELKLNGLSLIITPRGNMSNRRIVVDAEGVWTTQIPKSATSAWIWVWPYKGAFKRIAGEKVNLEKLKSQTLVTKMEKPYLIEGHLFGPDGKAASNINIFCENTDFSLPIFFLYGKSVRSDQNGYFRFQGEDPGEVTLTILTEDFRPEARFVAFSDQQTPLQIHLKKGNKKQVRLADKEGKPLSDVRVYLKWENYFWAGDWQQKRFLRPNSGGIWRFNESETEDVQIGFYKDGFISVWEPESRFTVEKDPLQAITLFSELEIRGGVFNAETGQAIHDYLIYGFEKTEDNDPAIRWTKTHSVAKTKDNEGKYLCVFSSLQSNYYLKVEAPGYGSAVSPAFDIRQEKVDYDFKLLPSSDQSGSLPDEIGEPEDKEIKMWDVDRPIPDC